MVYDSRCLVVPSVAVLGLRCHFGIFGFRTSEESDWTQAPSIKALILIWTYYRVDMFGMLNLRTFVVAWRRVVRICHCP